MHAPNQISLAAKASGEPEFREIGLGPWSETHPGEPRPDDPTSSNYDGRFDSVLLNDGDRRTVLVRTANAFQAKRVHIVGPHKWNRKGALMTELYQHVEHHPSIAELVESWHHRIAGEIAYERAKAGAAAIHAHDVAVYGDNKHLHELLAEIDACDARIKELQAARVIALDIIPGAVPMEAYAFPKRCLLLFGAEGPGLSEKALALADDVVYISQFGSVRSINAGAAAAVAMHAWIAQHAVSGV